MRVAVYSKPKVRIPTNTIFCPGCGHGIAVRLLQEALDELGVAEKTIGVGCIGCGGYQYYYTNVDYVTTLHGRAPAVASTIKRLRPDAFVYTYQGDGDLASIGTAETVHCAARGENITTLFVNNAIYGMTGGQLSPTTLVGQVTLTSAAGRSTDTEGYPIRVAELLSTLEAPVYIERVAVNTPQNVIHAKKAILKACRNQLEGRGFSLVEILSMCPSGWRVPASQGPEWVEQKMVPVFPLGVLRDKGNEE